MGFTWDPAKNERNIRRRGLSFEHAAPMWNGPMLVWTDTRKDYGEIRLIAIAPLGARLHVVVHVERGGERRIISARRANSREVAFYERETRSSDR